MQIAKRMSRGAVKKIFPRRCPVISTPCRPQKTAPGTASLSECHCLCRDARRLLITADGGGSNSSRNRLWKLELQRLADELGLKISVCHFPPGTSKWNRIEHRMFCHITRNWRGRPLVSCRVIVELIAAATTRAGLKIRSRIDDNEYPLGVKVSDERMKTLKIRRDGFHGDWNHTLINRSS